MVLFKTLASSKLIKFGVLRWSANYLKRRIAPKCAVALGVLELFVAPSLVCFTVASKKVTSTVFGDSAAAGAWEVEQKRGNEKRWWEPLWPTCISVNWSCGGILVAPSSYPVTQCNIYRKRQELHKDQNSSSLTSSRKCAQNSNLLNPSKLNIQQNTSGILSL